MLQFSHCVIQLDAVEDVVGVVAGDVVDGVPDEVVEVVDGVVVPSTH